MTTIPESIGSYRIEEQVGTGGMGAVYRATAVRDSGDAIEGQVVALKVIHAHLTQQDEYRLRFARETAIAQIIYSPNVVNVLDYGEFNGQPYQVMEFIPRSLADVFEAEGRFEPQRVLELMLGVAHGLEAAHRQDVIHRDLSLGNILIDEDGTAKVCDYGIARMTGMATLTAGNTFMGKPAYASPEHFSGTPDIRSDLYSTGIIMYQLLTGRLPWEAQTPLEYMRHHDSTPLPELPPNVPPALAAVVRKLTEKQPADRYRTPTELAEALSAAADAAPAAPTPVAPIAAAPAPVVAAPTPDDEATQILPAAAATPDDEATQILPSTPAPDDEATQIISTPPVAPADEKTQLFESPPRPPADGGGPPEGGGAPGPPGGRRNLPVLVIGGALVGLAVIAVLAILIFSGGGGGDDDDEVSGTATAVPNTPVNLVRFLSEDSTLREECSTDSAETGNGVRLARVTVDLDGNGACAGWSHVTSGGESGWVRDRSLVEELPTPTPTEVVADPNELAAGEGIVRFIGNTDGDGVGSRIECKQDSERQGGGIPEGDEVDLVATGRNDCEGWSKVTYKSVTSWVRDQYLVDVDTLLPEIVAVGCRDDGPLRVVCAPSSKNPVTRWEWAANGGVPSSGQRRGFTTTYLSAGAKVVRLTACNGDACISSNQTIQVFEGDPTLLVPDIAALCPSGEGPTLSACIAAGTEIPRGVGLQVWASQVPQGAGREWQVDNAESFFGNLPTLDDLEIGRHVIRLRHMRAGKISEWSSTVLFEVVQS